ncbi:MAG: hypothetical protein B7Y39_18865 [Bdellovibrio sp. 28-41-41]|nr:MAG: hypothetical protein B7Y39_18865 [Bdellovibrio sp. 28-41-41]|tara:strand:+ start:41267 stop:41986 length:720 start_codon:yes stop_codon:yes gene_type:complete
MTQIKVPRGNTQKGVNETVVRLLSENVDFTVPSVLLDIPCGAGEFARYLQSSYPRLKVVGVDIIKHPDVNFEFHQMEAHTYLKNVSPESFNVITCVSGIMCFDQIRDLFACFHGALNSSGLLIVTNDNFMTVRDRLNFIFFGCFKRFKLIYNNNEGIWNILPPQALAMHLRRNNFKNIRFEYASVYMEDWPLIPLALIVYPFFLTYLILLKSDLSIRERLNLFPLKSLIGRHYVVVARK